MSEVIKRSWLEDKNGVKHAPRTFLSQITTDDGILLEKKIDDDLNALKLCITPQMFGAGGVGQTDDTQAFNLAITEHNNTGKPIYIPNGTYLVYGGLTPIETPGIIFGTGQIVGTDTSGDAIMFDIKARAKISGITIKANGYNSAIRFNSTNLCMVEHCTINAEQNGITIKNSFLCSVKDCYIIHAQKGIAIISDNVDTGDNYVTGNTFDCSDGTSKSALEFYSGGGIRFINNKVLSYDTGINIVSTGQTSVMIIDGNSFENGKTSLNLNNTSSYGRIVFSNNQITKCKITLLKNTSEVQIIGNVITGASEENSICCTINDVQGKISFMNNNVSGYRYSVYSYKDIKDLTISNNNYDDYFKKLIAGNSAIVNETYDKTIATTGSAFNLIRIIPALNSSCIVEIFLSGATNKYSILRIINTNGNMSGEKIHGDIEFTCSAAGTLVCNSSSAGNTYAHITVKGCVNSIEGI